MATFLKKRMRDRLGRNSSDSPPLIRHGAERAIECDISTEGSLSRRSSGQLKHRRCQDISEDANECTSSVSSAEDASRLDDEYPIKTRSTVVNAIGREARWFYLDIVDAFARKEVNEVADEEGHTIKLFDEKATLSIVALRRDLKRMFAAAKPLIEAAFAMYDLLLWKNPICSLLLVIVYMYSIWIGWFWFLFFGLLVLQLSLNYAYFVLNVDVGINFLPRKEVNMPKLEMSSAQLIIDLAKLAQQLVNFGANLLEKLESLFTWKEPTVTLHFLCLCIYWQAWATFFSIGTCFGACAMTFGIRLFFTTYLFHKFPRLKYRLDTYGYFYRNLPVKTGEIPARPLSTDSRLFPSSLSLSKRNLSLDHGTQNGTALSLNGSRSRSIDERMIANGNSTYTLNLDADTSSIEEEEDIVEDVIDHRRCIMSEKDKIFPRSHVSGTLHLTPRALIFRSTADKTERMFVLEEIHTVRQVLSLRSLALLTGSRKGIEIEMPDVDGGLQNTSFVGMSKRDDFVDAIDRLCRERRVGVRIHRTS